MSTATSSRSSHFNQGTLPKTAIYSAIVVVVGLIFMVAGSVVAGVAYTEIRPNFADSNYNRYIGANLSRIVGPVLLVFGLIMFLGGCVYFAISFFSTSHHKPYINYNVRVSQEELGPYKSNT